MKKSAAAPFTPYAGSSPRSYDVGLLFCIRAINLAWKDIVRFGVDQMIGQWVLHNVCYVHTITDEGPNPRRPCPTDVEMQPLREVSSSVSPQRSSSGLLVAAGTCQPLAVSHTDIDAVDFSVIQPDSALQPPDFLSVSSVSGVGAGSGDPEFTPQHNSASFRPSHLHRHTGGRSSAATATRWQSHAKTTSAYPSDFGGSPRATQAAHLAPITVAPQYRHAFHNMGYTLVLELLVRCLEVSESVFCAVLQAFLAVLPRPGTTHAEISLAIFENYPYITSANRAASTGMRSDFPDILLQQSENASGNALKSFLVLMSILYNAASFERQCEVLEMAKSWREWLQSCYGHHLVSLAAVVAMSSPTSAAALDAAAAATSDEADAWIATQHHLREAMTEDTALVGDDMVRTAMLSRDVQAVANAVHRYFERRLGADGTGKALLEMLIHPTQSAPQSSHPIAFLFGVGGQGSQTSNGGIAHADGGAGATGDIHSAISSGILTFSLFYLSLRSTSAALRCADMAVLNSHQSGYVEGLAFTHLLRARCHVASGNAAAAAEDISIALQLSVPPAGSPAHGSSAHREWWNARALAYIASVELLIFYPGAVEPILRAALMRTPATCGPSDAALDSGASGSKGLSSAMFADEGNSSSATHAGSVEVVQTLAQTVRHTLWCAQIALLEECSSVSFQAAATVMCETMHVAASSLGVSTVRTASTEDDITDSLALLEEDKLVMPASRLWCTPTTLFLEHARMTVMQATHTMLADQYPANSANPMKPFRSLLNILIVREGSTDLLDHCFHFCLAVDLSAAQCLWDRGFATLAFSRCAMVLERLLGHLGEPHEPSTDMHWPPETLGLVLAATQLFVHASLFFGCRARAFELIERVLAISSMCSFPRGILFTKLLRARLLQAERNRSEQLAALLDTETSALDIGYLPLASCSFLQRVSAHLAVSDVAAARDTLKESRSAQLLPMLKRIPQHRVMLEAYQAMTGCGSALRSAAYLTKAHKSGALPLLTSISAAHTLLSVASSGCSHDLDTTGADHLLRIVTQSRRLVAERKATDVMRGLGDNLIATCDTIGLLCDADRQACQP